MAKIKEALRPAGCSCDWEDRTRFDDPGPMIERTTKDPHCRVHAKG